MLSLPPQPFPLMGDPYTFLFSFAPVLWRSIELHYYYYEYFIIGDLIDNAVRETIQKASSGIFRKRCPGTGKWKDILNGGISFFRKL